MKTTQSILASLAFCAGFSLPFSNAFAQDTMRSESSLSGPQHIETNNEYRPHIGAQFGISSAEGAYNIGSEFAADIGLQPVAPFGLGLEFGQTNSESREQSEDLRRTLALVKGSYNFGGDNPFIKFSYVGVGLGRSFGTGGDLWVSAPLAGFDIPISTMIEGRESAMSLGAVAKYFVYEGTNPDALSVDAMLKYWF